MSVASTLRVFELYESIRNFLITAEITGTRILRTTRRYGVVPTKTPAKGNDHIQASQAFEDIGREHLLPDSRGERWSRGVEDMEIVHIFAFSLLLTICQGRVIATPRQARLSLYEPMPYYYFNNDIDGHPGTYSYGYDVTDPATGNNQFRTEERYSNGTVVGSYGYYDAWGRPQHYRYVADERGYRVMREPTYKPYRQPAPPVIYPAYPAPANPSRPELYPSESSVTWTRPKKPNKKKNNNYYVNRPTHNFIGPPSSYAED